jgi:hypothetical protein
MLNLLQLASAGGPPVGTLMKVTVHGPEGGEDERKEES